MDFVESDKRLTEPLIKKNGKFEKATWEQAIALVAERLGQIRSEFGPDSIAGLSLIVSPGFRQPNAQTKTTMSSRSSYERA
jgi:predicted molibdopterin-dependent oxidoreductase YjgC